MKPVCEQHSRQSHDSREQNAVLQRETKELCLITHTHSSRRSRNSDGLQADHLAHRAADGVGRSHEDWTDAETARGHDLKVAEECIRRSIRTGEEDADPAQHRTEEWEERATGRERET